MLGLVLLAREPVDGNLADVIQNLVRNMLWRLKIKQRWRLVNEGGRCLATRKRWVCDHLLQKRQVGLDANNLKFVQDAVHLGTRLLEVKSGHADLHQ